MLLRTASLLSLLALVLATGCGDSGSSDSSYDRPTKTDQTTSTNTKKEEKSSSSKQSRGAKIMLASSDYGKILVDVRGITLYLFTKEKGKSECYDECAQQWPPFITGSNPSADTGLDQDLVGTTKRKDGTTQITYKGHPLYYYIGETKPGEVLCQGVEEFGGIWYVVNAKGDAVT